MSLFFDLRKARAAEINETGNGKILKSNRIFIWIASIFILLSATQPAQAASCPVDTAAYFKLDEAGSGLYADFTGGPDAVCRNGVNCPDPVSAGKIGRAQDFVRVNQDGLDAPGNPFDWTSTGSFSIEFWMKKSAACGGATEADNEVVVGRDGLGGGLGYWRLGVNCEGAADQGKLAFELLDAGGAGPDPVLSSVSVIDDKWHHVAAVRDGGAGQTYLYLDGRLVGFVPYVYTGGFDSVKDLNIGWLDRPGGFHFNGIVDEMALYDRALSDNEIMSHYFLARGYCEACDTPVRIMPLGDSITVGAAGSTDDTGYRRFLYLSLVGSDYDVNFVGSLTTGIPSDFDRQHEGHSGYEADGGPGGGIAPNIFNWLVTNPADVVLLHIGTNDIKNNESAVSIASQVDLIIENIDIWEAANNDVSVVLARIINRNDGYSAETTALNEQIQIMADARIANGDKIVVVDMENALIYPDDVVANDEHPNDSGYAKMADAWKNDLMGFLPTCPPLPLAITSHPFTTGFTGFPYVYDVTAVGNPATQFSLLQGPLDMTIDAPTGVITWTPVGAGEFAITVEAVNGTETDQQLFDVVVSNAPVCPDGITNYWRLDEPGGSTYLDFPGGDYGFCSDGDCPTSIAGKTNNAQAFNGINQKIVSDAGGTSPRNEVTMMAWVRPNTLTPDVQGILVKDNALRLELENNGECIDFTIWVNNGTKLELQPTGCAPPVGEWTHMAATYDGSTMTVYQNGDFIDSMSASGLIDANTNPYSIGFSEFQGQQRWFDGAIDDVVVFDRALDQGEIQQYIGMAPAGYCSLSGCAGDGDADGDVDGNDLAALSAKFAAGGAGPGEIAAFAGQLGKDDCQLTPY